jgi:hypothetical protein
MRKFLSIAFAVASLLLAEHGARAEASELEGQAAAHFERGVELYREGSLDAALVEFERAYELIPSYRLLYNLAQIQAERHEYATAVGLFEQYLRAGAEQVTAARRAEVQAEIAKLRARVAYLSVRSNVEGAKLFVNDALVASLPLSAPVPINSGVWSVRVEKPGYVAASAQLKVAGGERPTLELPLLSVERSRPLGAQPKAAREANYVPAWITSASALALGGATLGLGLAAHAADQDLDRALARFPARQTEIEDKRGQLKLYAGLTDACAAASIVALGVAVYLWIAPPRARGRSDAGSARVRLAPSQRGVGLRATF